MNKHGQTLIAFVLLVPVFLIFLAFVIDIGLILKEGTKLSSTTRTILKTTYQNRKEDNYQEKVKVLFQKNNIPTENIFIEINGNKITIANEYEIDSIFGNIIGLKKYKTNTKLTAIIENDNLKIKKE